LFATAGENSGNVHIWDLRMVKSFINDLCFHKERATTVEWSPFHEQLLASGSEDKKVYIWDNSRAGEEQARHDY
jgi:histone-binding protein RBBP4